MNSNQRLVDCDPYEMLAIEHFINQDVLLKSKIKEISELTNEEKRNLFLASSNIQSASSRIKFAKIVIKTILQNTKEKLKSKIPLLNLLDFEKINTNILPNELFVLLKNTNKELEVNNIYMLTIKNMLYDVIGVSMDELIFSNLPILNVNKVDKSKLSQNEVEPKLLQNEVYEKIDESKLLQNEIYEKIDESKLLQNEVYEKIDESKLLQNEVYEKIDESKLLQNEIYEKINEDVYEKVSDENIENEENEEEMENNNDEYENFIKNVDENVAEERHEENDSEKQAEGDESNFKNLHFLSGIADVEPDSVSKWINSIHRKRQASITNESVSSKKSKTETQEIDIDNKSLSSNDSFENVNFNDVSDALDVKIPRVLQTTPQPLPIRKKKDFNIFKKIKNDVGKNLNSLINM